MHALNGLPDHVADLIGSGMVLEFATVSSAGLPIDTPLLYFPAQDLSTVDAATGLAYPAKAERARRNPKVGLLIEGAAPGEPVVSIAGLARVEDTDIQGNLLRYISETASGGTVTVPWSVAQKAVWYWSRIIMKVQPKRIMWWDSAAAMDGPPQVWNAPADAVFRASDPAPSGEASKAPAWQVTEWHDLAKRALAGGRPAHLTLFDAEGFPLPFRVSDLKQTAQGFSMRTPKGAPWAGGGATTLSFEGKLTFVGKAAVSGERVEMAVERTLPALPMVDDLQKVWLPDPDTKAALMGRLTKELGRRGLSIPTIPLEEPTPTPGAGRRLARVKRLMAAAAEASIMPTPRTTTLDPA